MNRILMIVLSAGVVLGGIDRILGNRRGYGEKFEEGFGFLGPVALSMAGMICLAPVLSGIFGRLVIPFYKMIGVDPGMFGSILAIDMGGYQLAMELAQDPVIGGYAGIVAASVFGCTMVFTVPVGMGMVDKKDRPYFARGMMLGIVTMPVGLLAGGLLAGLSFGQCLYQNLPVLALAFVILTGLWKMPEKMILGFCAFAKGIRCVITVGLAAAAVEYLCGLKLILGMAPLGEAMEVVASVGIVMLGSLPVAEFLRRVLKKPFSALGARLGMNDTAMTGLLVGAVSAIPAIAMFGEMDERGKVANAAFLVSATSMLAAHMGFAVSTQPELLGAMLCAKICGSLSAFALAAVIQMQKPAAGAAPGTLFAGIKKKRGGRTNDL